MVSFSVLIITHGREELLLRCLDSLRPPVEKWQLIIVATGLPLSEQIVVKANSLTSEVDILHLPQKETQAKARNEGTKLVKYDWAFLIDEKANVTPRYFETLMPLLSLERVDVLGGPDIPAKGMDKFSEALAITLASPFCTGKTFSRHSRIGKQMIPATEEILSTFNLWIRTQFLREIPFPENYHQAEEIAFLMELQKRGAHMYYHPSLVVAHYRQENLKSLLRSTFYSGCYRSKVMKEKSAQSFGYFWLPSIFVLLHLLIFIEPQLFFSFLRIYLGIIVMMSLNLGSRRQKLGLFVHISFLHYFIVFVYGLGFLANRWFKKI